MLSYHSKSHFLMTLTNATLYDAGQEVDRTWLGHKIGTRN